MEDVAHAVDTEPWTPSGWTAAASSPSMPASGLVFQTERTARSCQRRPRSSAPPISAIRRATTQRCARRGSRITAGGPHSMGASSPSPPSRTTTASARSCRRAARAQVLVIDGRGSVRRALCGGNVAALAAVHGWAGLVVNGCIRDAHEIADLDLGVKAVGATPLRPRPRGVGEGGRAGPLRRRDLPTGGIPLCRRRRGRGDRGRRARDALVLMAARPTLAVGERQQRTHRVQAEDEPARAGVF